MAVGNALKGVGSQKAGDIGSAAGYGAGSRQGSHAKDYLILGIKGFGARRNFIPHDLVAQTHAADILGVFFRVFPDDVSCGQVHP